MNALALELLVVAKEYLGPAAPAFLSRELQALGVTTNSVEAAHVIPLADRARLAATRVMDHKRAGEFAEALAQRGGKVRPKTVNDHRLASDAAAKLFASGKLRQAETAYRELVRRHGDVESYSGLARTLVSLEDRTAALALLREGAGELARKNDRVSAIALLGLAVDIAPGDLAAHRRLAAALANQGDLISACQEYARYVDVALFQNDIRRAWLELAYGRETLGDLPQLLALADRVAAVQGGAKPTPPPSPRAAATPSTTARPAALRGAPSVRMRELAEQAAIEARQRSALMAAVNARTRPQASSAVHLQNAETVTHADRGDLGSPLELLARAGLSASKLRNEVPIAAPPRPARPRVDLEAELAALAPSGNAAEDAALADLRATILIGAGDPRATPAALDAARKLMALRKLQAASDVLLDLIGAGFKDREAQRLLIEVNCELGFKETARTKCQLLGTAYRLDGQGAIAENVERLARIL